jgi:APA family basic amino acid/polyamine antiporter
MAEVFFTRKSINDLIDQSEEKGHKLKRVLSAVDLTFLGIGAVIGTGIFVLTGVAAASHAGPAVILSFIISGLACAFAALCYAEFASMIPVAGSAYTYSYATLGELFAWIIGWDLILEYAVASIAVSIGWSGYFVMLLKTVGIHLPEWLCQPPFNLPAATIVFIMTTILVIGIRESARFNNIMVIVKLCVIVFFILFGAFFIRPENWYPFIPFGWTGIMTGAAIVFFAYIGFDAVSTTAEEAKNPKRDLPIGIIVSLFICTLLYIAVAAVLTGIVPVGTVANDQSFLSAPVAYALSYINQGWASGIISIGAIMGITSVLLVMLMGQPRVFFAMSRDNLLPKKVSAVHPKFGTPYITTIITGLVVAFVALVVPIGTAAELANIGTLFAFAIVSSSVLVLRKKQPDINRPFKTPFVYLIAPLGVLSSLWLMYSLPVLTWIRFVLWLDIGIIIYYFYGRLHSRLAKKHNIIANKSFGHFSNFFGIIIACNGLLFGLLSVFAKIGLTGIKTWEELHFTPDQFLLYSGIAIVVGIVLYVIAKFLNSRTKK